MLLRCTYPLYLWAMERPGDDQKERARFVAAIVAFVVVVAIAWVVTRPWSSPGVELSECGDQKCTVTFDRHASDTKAHITNLDYRLIEVVDNVVTLRVGRLAGATRRIELGKTDHFHGRAVTVRELTDDHVVLTIADETAGP